MNSLTRVTFRLWIATPKRDYTDKLLYHQALNYVLTHQTGNYPVTCFVSNYSSCIRISESWWLENAKSPATILQENNPDATSMSIYRACTWYFVVFAMHTCACLEACDDRAFVAINSMTNRHGHWVRGTSACWMSMCGKNTAISSVEHAKKKRTPIWGYLMRTHSSFI